MKFVTSFLFLVSVITVSMSCGVKPQESEIKSERKEWFSCKTNEYKKDLQFKTGDWSLPDSSRNCSLMCRDSSFNGRTPIGFSASNFGCSCIMCETIPTTPNTKVTVENPAYTSSYVFSPELYYELNIDLKVGSVDLRDHWLKAGIRECRTASYAFSATYYLTANPDLKAAFGLNCQKAIEHYIGGGIAEGRASSLIFDVKYYLEANPDLKAAFGKDYQKASQHFLNGGIAEGRRSSNLYDGKYYLDNNPDVRAAVGGDYAKAAAHFIATGHRENRKSHP